MMATSQNLIESGRLRKDVPLGPLTTYKSGGPASLFYTADGLADLQRLVESGLARQRKLLVLGRGSNIVVADEGFDGLVIQLDPAQMGSRVGDAVVTAGAAAPLPRLARQCAEEGWTGLEFFVGVPGSVGGAVRQNAGCFGVETADVLEDADLIDLLSGQERTVDAEGLALAYRSSNVQRSEVVVTARFRLEPGRRDDSLDRMREITRWRKENQPGGTFNAGSVFKNPDGEAAGALIDRLGLKGTSVGDVAVSEKHANFFVAGTSANSADIKTLVNLVKDRVFAETGTILEPEIQFVGFDE